MHPSGRELHVLSVLWELKEATVAQIHHELTERWEPTVDCKTVQSFLIRLERKHCVQVDRGERPYFYAPLFDRDYARRLAFDQLLELYFNNSLDELRAYLETRTRTLPFSGARSSAVSPSPPGTRPPPPRTSPPSAA